MSNEKSNYQEKRLWLRKYMDAKASGDEVARRRAYKKLLELTEGTFREKS